MSLLLFGGSIFPAHPSLESSKSLYLPIVSILKKWTNCPDCTFSPIDIVGLLALSALLSYLIFKFFSNKTS